MQLRHREHAPRIVEGDDALTGIEAYLQSIEDLGELTLQKKKEKPSWN